MRILSQDKRILIEAKVIWIEESASGTFKIYAEAESTRFLVGEYSTNERAIQEITCLSNYNGHDAAHIQQEILNPMGVNDR